MKYPVYSSPNLFFSLLPSSSEVSTVLMYIIMYKYSDMDFPGGMVIKNPPASAGEAGWIPGSGRSPGVGNDNRLHCSCLESSMNRGTKWVTVHGVAESDTTEHAHMHSLIVKHKIASFSMFSIIETQRKK